LGLAPAWPLELCLANRAFCARLIFLRTAADIVRRLPVLVDLEPNPDRAETAASSRPNSNAALSLAAFNCASISMYSPSGWDCSKRTIHFSGQKKRAQPIRPRPEIALLILLKYQLSTCNSSARKREVYTPRAATLVFQVIRTPRVAAFVTDVPTAEVSDHRSELKT
jgi:hypothetical protein